MWTCSACPFFCFFLWFTEDGSNMFLRNFGPSPRYTSLAKQAELSACLWWFLTWFTFRPWRWRQYVAPKLRAAPKLHGGTTQKTVLLRYNSCLWRTKKAKEDLRMKISPWSHQFAVRRRDRALLHNNGALFVFRRRGSGALRQTVIDWLCSRRNRASRCNISPSPSRYVFTRIPPPLCVP
jgi:hypothetical protein